MGKKVAPGSGGGLITKTDAELTSEHLRSKNRDKKYIFYLLQFHAFQVLLGGDL